MSFTKNAAEVLVANPFEGYSKLSREQRVQKLREHCTLTDDEIQVLESGGLKLGDAEHLIENVVGTFSLPLGIATNFLIDGRDVPVPMVVEETSIVAAASAAAKWVRRNGGFETQTIGSLIIGQVQFPTIRDSNKFQKIISENKEAIISAANAIVPNLVNRGGGVRDILTRYIDRPDQNSMAVLHILCDPCDAMGANLINQICEGLKPVLEGLTGENIGLCILSNLVDTKLVEAKCEISDIDPQLGSAIEEATLFAQLDPYRSATHVKGIMNGIDPVVIATGNDWRAVEAGIHTFAALSKDNRSISEWKYRNGKLYGRIRLPLALGTVGGVTKLHPSARLALKILGVSRAEDLGRICASVGLAQNLGALRALCSEGIIRGHMRLHATNFALLAGANKDELRLVEEALRQESAITLSRAQQILAQIRAN